MSYGAEVLGRVKASFAVAHRFAALTRPPRFAPRHLWNASKTYRPASRSTCEVPVTKRFHEHISTLSQRGESGFVLIQHRQCVNDLRSILWPFLRTTLITPSNCAVLLADWRLLVDLRPRSPIGAPCFNMPVPVTTFCAYRTRRNGPWTDRDHAASKFIKALKEQPVSGWAYVPVGKEHVRLDAANAASAPDIFARQAAHGMKWEQVGALMFVPIPDSSCTMSTTHPPRTIKMAVALLRCIESVDAIVADLLRWSEAMTPAHVGLGTRDPEDLFRRLRLRGPVPPNRRVVLIDDVMASGGHVRAAAAFLDSQGATIVTAICAARADDRPVIGDAFAIRTVTLESLAVSKQPAAY